MSLRSLLVASIASLAVTATAHAATFGLGGSVGATPTFSITSGGATATFTSPAGNQFAVQSTAGLFSFNPGLVDGNFFGTDPLTISFSAPISGSLLIPFGFVDSGSTTDALTVRANTGQTATFLAVPNGLLALPESTANLALATPITSVTLSSPTAFAIGNVSTVAPVVPEPASLVLLATGMTGMVLRRRRA